MQGATPINFPQMMADAGVHKNRTHIKILLANEAVSIAGKVSPNLILLDVQMPDCDGYTAAFQLRQLATFLEVNAISDILNWANSRLASSPDCTAFYQTVRNQALHADLAALKALLLQHQTR